MNVWSICRQLPYNKQRPLMTASLHHRSKFANKSRRGDTRSPHPQPQNCSSLHNRISKRYWINSKLNFKQF